MTDCSRIERGSGNKYDISRHTKNFYKQIHMLLYIIDNTMFKILDSARYMKMVQLVSCVWLCVHVCVHVCYTYNYSNLWKTYFLRAWLINLYVSFYQNYFLKKFQDILNCFEYITQHQNLICYLLGLSTKKSNQCSYE